MKRLVLPLLVLTIAVFAPTASGASSASPPGLAPGKIEALIELQHPGGLNRFVRKVSDPRSAHYRDYATVEQLIARFGAPPKTQKRVMRWLRAHGLHGRVSATGTFVTTSVP